MKIGIIHGFIGGGGGTEKTLHAIIEALEKTEHDVTLYTFSKPKIKTRIKINTTLPFSISSFGLYQRVMESKLIKKAKNEDLLIMASGGLGIPSKPDQKILVYCHSDFSNELDNPSTKYKGLWSIYYKSYYEMIKKFVQNINNSNIHLISNSKFVHDSILSKFDKESSIIYPPVNLNEFNPENKKTMVITIGRFSDEKNLNFGMNVMKEIDCDYKIIGNTKTKSNILCYNKLESEIKNKNLKKIHLLKNIQRNELIEITNKAKVYLHCSNETFGISVVESVSAGCVPIVPDTSAHKETVPFLELRYQENQINEAKKLVQKAISGEFDHLLSPLKESIQKFSNEYFKKSLLNEITQLK